MVTSCPSPLIRTHATSADTTSTTRRRDRSGRISLDQKAIVPIRQYNPGAATP